MIYHICTSSQWERFSDSNAYEDPSLQKEGFIHCSTAEQVQPVLKRYFEGVDDLLLLHIQPDLLEAELKYELSTGNELYPHIYGKINKKAIVEVERL